MKRSLGVGVLWLAMAACGSAAQWDQPGALSLDPLLATGAVWSATAADFAGTFAPLGFHWEASNLLARSRARGLQFLGLEVWEATVRFERAGPRQVQLSLYNRGDAGDLGAARLDELLALAAKTLDEWTGVDASSAREERSPLDPKVRRRTWTARARPVELEWSFTPAHREPDGTELPFKAEYVNLRCLKPGTAARLPTAASAAVTAPAAAPSLSKLKARVRHPDSGDVVIDSVPMVNQGEKGYCAAAVAERLLRYYGQEIDQHEIAQIAKTSAASGTTPDAMITALRRIAARLHLQVKELQDFEYQDFVRLIQDYNRARARTHKPEITYGNVIDVLEVYREMDIAVLHDVRVKRKTELERFRTQVREQVQAGIPLIWSLVIGKIDEPDVEILRMGGHMRLIIGFHAANDEILYTDTWGPGHELKRMPIEDAWTVTTGLYSLKPTNW